MGENYIKEASLKFLRDNGLSEREVFAIKSECYNDVNRVYFKNGNAYSTTGILMKRLGYEILHGIYTVEKIKPKTLMEQLKEQEFGWEVCLDGNTYKRDIKIMQHNSYYYKQIMQGNMFLTKSEAEREVYRRKLEFEMQEWARENECLLEVEDICKMDEGDFSDVFFGFNVYVKREFEQKIRHKFTYKADKYINWRD